mgnify:CR=1 FL=1
MAKVKTPKKEKMVDLKPKAEKITDEQLQMIERFINTSFWPSKLKSYPADHMLVQDTAREAKIV